MNYLLIPKTNSMKNLVSLLVVLASIASFAQNSNALQENLYDSYSISTALDQNGFKFDVLDAGMNTKFFEYGSGFFMNKFIVVTSRKIGGLDKTNTETGESDKNLFCFDFDKNGNLSLPLLFSHFINSLNHEDTGTFSPNEKHMFFTRSSIKNPMVYELYKADLKPDSKGVWENIKKVNLVLNNASIENPSMSPDGKMLYFASNVDGGFGGFDIYQVSVSENGELGIPLNLGSEVNTSEDDKFPTFSKDGTYLYFASKGHQNAGGFDMFRSKIGTQNFSKPINLGTSINTKYDEIAMYFASNTKGYISSNKIYGKGGFDIYKFELELVEQKIEGKILDEKSLIALPNATIVLRDFDDAILETVKSDNKGTYTFNILPFEKYSVSVEKDGFKPTVFEFLSNKGDSRTYMKNILLETTEAEIVEIEDEEVIKVENILFEFDKSNIQEESTIALNKIYKVLIDHPEMNIKLNAHSDQKGSSAYNLKLSERRAAAAKDYLIVKGIEPSRIQSKGFGETKPLINCNTKCTDEENATNRRVEFIIIK